MGKLHLKNGSYKCIKTSLGKSDKKVTPTQIQTIINQGIRKGSWNLLSDGSVKILYKYKGKIIVITGKVVDKIFRIGDAWVWNGKGKP